MLLIPVAQLNYIDPCKALARLFIVPTKERYLRQQFCHSNIADLNLNCSDLAGS